MSLTCEDVTNAIVVHLTYRSGDTVRLRAKDILRGADHAPFVSARASAEVVRSNGTIGTETSGTVQAAPHEALPQHYCQILTILILTFSTDLVLHLYNNPKESLA